MALIPISSRFNFYQQIRLILRKLRKGKTCDSDLLAEKLHIHADLSLNAPEGEIIEIRQDTPSDPIKITTGHNGLIGTMGALPKAYTEWLIERLYHHKDSSAKAFIELFEHRLYTLDYLAWQKHHLYALSEATGGRPLENSLLSLSGLLMSKPTAAMALNVALFAAPVRSMVNLERWLRLLFQVPVEVVPFTGGWQAVAAQECCQLGNSANRLSTAPMLGRTRLEPYGCFDVLFGPMSQAQSRPFLAPDTLRRAIWQHISDYVGPVLNFAVYLLISSVGLESSPLGSGILGWDLSVGVHPATMIHRVRLPAPEDFHGKMS